MIMQTRKEPEQIMKYGYTFKKGTNVPCTVCNTQCKLGFVAAIYVRKMVLNLNVSFIKNSSTSKTY